MFHTTVSECESLAFGNGKDALVMLLAQKLFVQMFC